MKDKFQKLLKTGNVLQWALSTYGVPFQESLWIRKTYVDKD